jgi:hypothetical protein
VKAKEGIVPRAAVVILCTVCLCGKQFLTAPRQSILLHNKFNCQQQCTIESTLAALADHCPACDQAKATRNRGGKVLVLMHLATLCLPACWHAGVKSGQLTTDLPHRRANGSITCI